MGDFNGKNYSDRFISSLVTFVAGDSFQTKFETFFLAHALKFTYDEEHRLEYYEIYQEFSSMFENELEGFMRSQDMTQAEFVRRCRNAGEEDAKVKHYIEILLSSCEYETFVKLMKVMRPVAELRQLNAARAADAKNTSSEGAVGASSPSKYEKSSSKGGDDNEEAAQAKAIEMDDLSDVKGSSSSSSGGGGYGGDEKGVDSK